jgi:hypothetical protein
VSSAAVGLDLGAKRSGTPVAVPGKVRNVPTAAAQQGLSAERSDRPTTQPGYDRNVSVAADQEVRKLPFDQISAQ